MRKPFDFYRDLDALREDWGNIEYNRDDLRDQVMALLVKHGITESALLRDAADQTLDSVEKAEDRADPDQPELFSYDKHMALGDKRRVKRGKANAEQLYRRKRLIDHNKAGQDRAWAAETNWLHYGVDALRGHAPSTVRDQVITEDGRPVAPAEPEPTPEPVS